MIFAGVLPLVAIAETVIGEGVSLQTGHPPAERLEQADLRLIVDFFLLLDRWDKLQVDPVPTGSSNERQNESNVTPSIIYTRVSSREQQQEGFSLGAQAKLLHEYGERNQFQIVKAFEDVETAKTSGRKQFNEMVSWLKRNRSCRTLLVEKTDRLYRNLKDAVTLEELDIEIHLVKESQIISKDAKSQAKLIHGINLVLARNYSENLKEEMKKGMREKASQGIYPGHAPFGYRNNKAEQS